MNEKTEVFVDGLRVHTHTGIEQAVIHLGPATTAQVDNVWIQDNFVDRVAVGTPLVFTHPESRGAIRC